VRSSSLSNYIPAGHITGHVDEDLKSLIRKDPKFREPRSFNWRQNFASSKNAVEDYAKRWAKRENEELDTLSECVKSIREILKFRIRLIDYLRFYVPLKNFSLI
jgi:hypothetical protein